MLLIGQLRDLYYSSVGWSIVQLPQGCGFDSPSGPTQESTSEWISKRDDRLMFLSLSLPSPLSIKINIKSINYKIILLFIAQRFLWKWCLRRPVSGEGPWKEQSQTGSAGFFGFDPESGNSGGAQRGCQCLSLWGSWVLMDEDQLLPQVNDWR